MPPLRILHLNSMLHGGGTDDQCIKLADGLRRLGQTVFIAGSEEHELAKTVHSLGIPLLDTGNTKGITFTLAAARLIRREKIQIVHGHHGRDLWPTVLAARLSGQNPLIILTRHMAKSPSSWFSRFFLLNRCHAMIAVSQFVAKVLREGFDDPQSPEAERHHRPPLKGNFSKIHVIYGGLDTQRFCPADAQKLRSDWGLSPEHHAFAVAGGYSLPKGKGQREFLQAAAQIHEAVPNARFLIIGRGNMADLLQEDIKRLGLQKKAWLTPYCNDMPAAMNAVDCLVHPQIGTEAFGLVVCEAHACGRPVIASALDGIPEAFDQCAYGKLVPPEDINALAQAMREWAAHPPLTMEQRWDFHAQIDHAFSLNIMGENVLRLYQELLITTAK